MLTKITIRNFKLFEEVAVPLGNGFVFIGPNNSGKTSALQALALWHAGLQKWTDKHLRRGQDEIPTQRPGVTVSRLDLIPLPVAELDLIWLNRRVRHGPAENIRIELVVEGISHGKAWKCGLEYNYANPEALYCRPLRLVGTGKNPERMDVPREALATRPTFLPPMSGLASEEALIQEGRINVLIGQGQTAEVLRNLCHRVYAKEDKTDWDALKTHIKKLFGVTLNAPQTLPHRGAVTVSYTDGKTTLDLPSSGRGMQQVLLLLAHLYHSPENTVLLLDEPDAHLEILRQRQIYNLIVEVAEERKSQVIAASHSELLLGEATQRESAVAFVGAPHILGEGQQHHVMSALKEIGFEYYYEAESKGWILYLEGESGLRILQAFARRLQHPAEDYLQAPLVKYLGDNQPNGARRHFNHLRAAQPALIGVLLLDRVDKSLKEENGLSEKMWEQREIENYLCNRAAIMSYITSGLRDDLFGNKEKEERQKAMEQAIKELETASRTLDKPLPFSTEIKASDDFLAPLFRNFVRVLAPETEHARSLCLLKRDFYKLVEHIPHADIDPEVVEKLDAIATVAEQAKPRAA